MTRTELITETTNRCIKAVNNDWRKVGSIVEFERDIKNQMWKLNEQDHTGKTSWMSYTYKSEEETIKAFEKTLKRFCKKYDTNNEILNFYESNK